MPTGTVSRHQDLRFQCHEVVQRFLKRSIIAIRKVVSSDNRVQGNASTELDSTPRYIDYAGVAASRKNNQSLACSDVSVIQRYLLMEHLPFRLHMTSLSSLISSSLNHVPVTSSNLTPPRTPVSYPVVRGISPETKNVLSSTV